MSPLRILRLSLLLTALIGVAFFTHPLLGRSLARRAAAAAPDPVYIPGIYGLLQIRNASPAGVDIRVGHYSRDGHHDCRSLPVRARTSAKGIFYIREVHHPRSIDENRLSMVEVCLMKGRQVLTHFFLAYDTHGQGTTRFFCRYPAPHTGHPEDQVCTDIANNPYKPFLDSEWFEPNRDRGQSRAPARQPATE